MKGYKNNIPPILLRHPVNCQLITHAQNVAKAHKERRYEDGDSINLKTLFKLIKNFKGTWEEQKECMMTIMKKKGSIQRR